MYEQLDLFEVSNQMAEETEEEEERRPQKSSLTPRQWALYRLIQHNSLVEHRKTTQKEIYEKLKDYGYEWSESNNTSDHCSTIWSDVTANNLSLEHDTIIITKNYIYWIGSRKETEAFLRKLWKDLSPRLHRYWFYVTKLGMDGQGKLYDKNLNPIYHDDETATSLTTKLFHDCFNDYDVTMQKVIEDNKDADKELNKEESATDFEI